MYKCIIFDLDGTLLDTSKDIHKVLNGSLSAFGLPEIPLNKTIEYVGNGARLLVERAVPADRRDAVEEVYRHYSEHFAKCDNNLTALYEGEARALEEFKKRGIKLAILTNKPQAATEGVYKKHLARFGFDCVLGQTDNYPLKPNPAATLHIISQLGVKKEECVFVGDGETDVMTAKNASVDCVSVLWGFRTRAQLQQAGAVTFAENYDALSKIIMK